ncbi:Hint domain-containing protein [Paracoccus caeni]|uniref:Hint domain-containing protein n=2 Tax=Paracoccus caeni TaxID=657651 RepID=A0A934W0G9_9RHOB|nr:Hint domain-containing protein [Paracoccus caeni]
MKIQSVQILAVNTTNYINWTLPPDITGSEIVCFATGTLIDTEHGPIPVEDLEIGMNVRTLDRGLQPIRWLGSRRLTSAELAVNEKLRPIRIRRGVLAENVPDRDLIVSPQHRILVSSPIAQRMFGAREVLVAAKQLLVLDGVEIADDIGDVTYHHFLFDRHEIVTSNGAMTESLFPGGEALKAVGPEAREEIFAIFPEWRDNLPHFEAAREFPAAHQARKLALRHQQNGKPLFASD